MAQVFNCTYQTTAVVCGTPIVSPEVLTVCASSYHLAQKFTISQYGEISLILQDDDGIIQGKATFTVRNEAIKDGILAFPGQLACRYQGAASLREHAEWLADLSTAILAAQAQIETLLTPEPAATV
jgi:hypothetical protein